MKNPIGNLLWHKIEISIAKSEWSKDKHLGVIDLLIPFQMVNNQKPINRTNRIRIAIKLKFKQLFGAEAIKEQICIIKESNLYGGQYKTGIIRGVFYIDNKEVYDNVYNYFINDIKL